MRDGAERRLAGAPIGFVEIQAGAVRSERWAVDALADEYLPRLRAFASARGAKDPEGVANTALLTVLLRLDELDFATPEQFWAYLCLTARSRVIDEHRVTRPVDLVGDLEALDIDVGSPFDDRVVNRELIRDLLAPLPADQRRVLQMRFLDDLSIEQTAQRIGRSQGAVRGLQTRAIKAILAAVAIVVVVLAARSAGRGQVTVVNDDPADQAPVDAERSDEESGGPFSDGTGSVEGEPIEVDGGGGVDGAGNTEAENTRTGETRTGETGAGAAGADPSVSADVGDGRFRVTVGTNEATRFDATGASGPENEHGVRVYCVPSHFDHADPILAAGRPSTGPANVFWGNTGTDAFAAERDLTTGGAGTCEGGVVDRSAYWMPALFDDRGRVRLPEGLLVEYKTFGPVGFDRSVIQPIPAGMQLLAGPLIEGYADRSQAVSEEGDSLAIRVEFPSCVQVDPQGRPVLSSGTTGEHLAYPDGGCSASHPYRIPTLIYAVRYSIEVGSGWSFSSGFGDADLDASRAGRFTAGAISAWDSETMGDVVRCVRELLSGCEFGFSDGGGRRYREQLPERFSSPGGELIYRNSVSLAPGVDPAPFDDAMPATAP